MPGRMLILALGVIGCVAPTEARAQWVSGRVADQASGRGLDGALVVALDSAEVQVRAVLTDAEGRFLALLPAPGRYRLRVDRIGYRSTFSEPVRLAGQDTVHVRMPVPVEPVRLAEFRVQAGERTCAVDARTGAVTAGVWAEARKALESAAVASELELTFDAITFSRQVALDSTALYWEDRELGATGGSLGFVSPPAEELARRGYVQKGEDDVREYYLPDAHVLLSDAFLRTHCFDVRWNAAGNRIGLWFEPAGDDGPPDVEGTLWLDARTSELQHMEARFVRLDEDVARDQLGGRVDFERLDRGPWIVRRWVIRMPVIRERWRPFFFGKSKTLLAFEEAGGEVVDVFRGSGEVVSSGRTATLTGVVSDSVKGAPLPGAALFVAGLDRHVRTDSAGRFRIDGLPLGRHLLTFWHPWLDTLGIDPVLVPAVVEEGANRIDASVPRADRVVERVCGDARLAGVLNLRAWDQRTNEPQPGTWVSLLRQNEMPQEGFTNDDGFITFCRVPMDQPVRVYAENEVGSISGYLQPSPSGFTFVEFVLGEDSQWIGTPPVADQPPGGAD